MDEIVPAGTHVWYFGSIEEYGGREFVITHTHTPYHSASLYPGGVAYALALTDDRRQTLSNVRRSSFTVDD